MFNSLDELVQYYHDNADGLCCQLTIICPKYKLDISIHTKKTKNWEVERSAIIKKKMLWEWRFGKVYEGVWDGTEPVAIKTPASVSMKARLYFLDEAHIMKKICKKHENLLELYALCSEDDPIYIVTEPMQNGRLLDYLQQKDLSLPQLIAIAAQVNSGMAYLEEQHIIHRDLRAKNVLVGVANKVKITNFGLARTITDNEFFAPPEREYALKWMAPEAIFSNRFTMKCDIWSFGIFLTELITHGTMPYQGMTKDKALKKVNLGYRMPSPPDCPDYLYQVMMNCWDKNPERRPTFESLISRVTIENCSR